MMLSVDNLREYCRTCLVKLGKTGTDNSCSSIPIKQSSDLEHFIKVCLAKPIDDTLCYTPFLCSSCFDKWSSFLQLYLLAIKTEEKIKRVLEQGFLEAKHFDYVKQNDNITECIINTETSVDINEIAKHNNTRSIVTPRATDQHEGNTDTKKKIDFAAEPKNDKQNAREKPEKHKNNKNVPKSLHVPKECNKTTRALLHGTENLKMKKIRYQCQQCSKYFWERNKYEGHMKQVHEGIERPYKCQDCDKAYNLYKSLLQHKRECHGEKLREVFKCGKCFKLFKTGVILKQHISNKHSEQKDNIRSICDQCGFIAAHQYSLSRHIINRHTERDRIKCDQCPKVFKTRYSLKYHIIGNHNPSNIKPFKCSECQMGFTRKTLLNQHKRTHLKYTERMKCDFEGCEVRFVKHGDKTHHMRLVHLKVRQHICDFCGEAFGAMQTLRHHRFIHTGEKPYKCNDCGQGFRQRTAMKTHRKTHIRTECEGQDLIKSFPEIKFSSVDNLCS